MTIRTRLRKLEGVAPTGNTDNATAAFLEWAIKSSGAAPGRILTQAEIEWANEVWTVAAERVDSAVMANG